MSTSGIMKENLDNIVVALNIYLQSLSYALHKKRMYVKGLQEPL
jgi:hypothetical protein